VTWVPDKQVLDSDGSGDLSSEEFCAAVKKLVLAFPSVYHFFFGSRNILDVLFHLEYGVLDCHHPYFWLKVPICTIL
jgi:hypothetical protein